VLLFQIILLGLAKGLGELLPIGGTGLLSLVPTFSGWSDPGPAIDLAGALGALVAILIFFFRELPRLIKHRFGGRILLGSLFFAAPGGAAQVLWMDRLGGLAQIAVTTIVVALLMLTADRWGRSGRSTEDLGLGEAILMGLVQALAVLPGSGRVALAIVAARCLGFERREAARLGFLFSIPCLAAIALSSAVRLQQQLPSLDPASALHDGLLVGLATAVAGLAAIAFVMAWLKERGLALFAGYRLIFGAVLLYAAFGGVL
jgi:undecaprenyl-diphosphatase